MDLKQLMEAATRFNDGRLCEHATKVADAFLNPDPITSDALESLGPSTRGCGWSRFSFGRLILREQEDETWLAFIDTMTNPANPQPKTMGDVYALYRLSRTGV